MKTLAIFLTVVFLVPITVFAQDSRDLMAEYCEQNWKNDPSGCSEYAKDGRFTTPEPSHEPKGPEPASQEDVQTIRPSSEHQKFITFDVDSVLPILVVGSAVIVGIGVAIYVIIHKRGSAESTKVEQRHSSEHATTNEELESGKKNEQRKYQKLQKGEQKEPVRDKERQKGEPASESIAIGFGKEPVRDKERQKGEQNKERQKEMEAKRIFQEKAQRNESLYDPSDIESLEHDARIRIFYDRSKKDSKYWNDTNLIDRIRVRDKEIRDEIEIRQNLITFRISLEGGQNHKFAKMISGGNMEFWDHDSPGYLLQIHLSKPEEFVKLVMIKNMRYTFPQMSVYESSHTITGILLRKSPDHLDASSVLKKIVRNCCEEILEMGDILVEA